jgi:hypothetical protein
MAMRRHIFIVSALSLLFVLHTVPARAQTTAAGPYLATPAWDQKLQCDTLTTCPRFVVLSNWNSEAVLDRETGLVWERSPDTTKRKWLSAYFHCTERVVSNRSGWRLPSVHELLTLIDPAASFGVGLAPGHPFLNVQEFFYWSATTFPYDRDFFKLTPFLGTAPGFGLQGSNRDNLLPAWCVRGGQGVDIQ